jgi:2,4-diaminopentanoate dehydrogenase
LDRRGETEDVLPVLVVGLGEVGRAVVRAVASREDLVLVAAVDPAHVGLSLRECIGGAAAPGLPDLKIEAPEAKVLSRAKGGVALVATASRLHDVLPILEAAASAGANVVSTCEELTYPFLSHPELAERIEALFSRKKVTCLATGVNPGFVLDRLPAFLGGVVGEVRHVLASRRVDVSTRRPALQHKIGLGLTVDAFEARSAKEAVGHLGLVESAALVAEGLGLDADEVDESIEPIVAEIPFDTGAIQGEAGTVAGIRQEARVFRDEKEVVRLELEMAVGLSDPADALMLDADPPVALSVPGGFEGEAATAWAVVNAAWHVAHAEPGLMTVLDLPAGR